MKIAYLTAGAAGMFCGSCMHDNTLARALIKLGCDVQLVPLYTPIRTDEENVAIDRVFMGGINVYLQQKFPILRFVPRWMKWWLDSPILLRFADSLGIKTTAKDLGRLAVSVLQGDHGYQKAEVDRLATWLTGELKPELIVFTNMLVAGSMPAIKKRLDLPIVVTLQGDDIFLSDLLEPFKSQAFAEIRRLMPYVDGFIVNSVYYADFMSEYLGAPREKFHIVPLGLDTKDFVEFIKHEMKNDSTRPPTIGYLARLAPEKGLDVLVDAFIHLHREMKRSDYRLRVAGWIGNQHRIYVAEQVAKIKAAGLSDKFELVGEIDRAGKIAFLKSIDVLSVPTPYREPKGLFVLESLAAGVPVVQPNHGAFPELLGATGGGLLVPPSNPPALAQSLDELLRDPTERESLARPAQARVHQNFSSDKMAAKTLEVLRRVRRL